MMRLALTILTCMRLMSVSIPGRLVLVLKANVDQILVLCGKSQHLDNDGVRRVHYDNVRIVTLVYFSEFGVYSVRRIIYHTS
ncbi:hypothetical protein F5146DRAFT_1054819 [Armillaria mellea]|nr:hypothetical protein F5146DRAFT_1054819 [Armillaria mellea]